MLFNLCIIIILYTGDQMYDPLWECISRLERMDFKVMGLVCDGLTANRKLFNIHVPDNKELVHSIPNPYTSEKRPFLFFSDPPHLIKTVRNAWQNNKRHLQVYLWDQQSLFH